MKTIAWDVDDVLNDLMRAWFVGKWLVVHPDCSLQYDEITENPPHRLLGVSLNDYLSSLDDFRLSSAYRELEPAPEILDWLSRNGRRFRHVALTSVPRHAASVSSEWVFRNFGSWIRTFHFVPSPRDWDAIPEYDRTKGDFLRQAGFVDVLVDDSPANVTEAAQAGVRGILVPRPWNGNGGDVTCYLSILSDMLQ